MRRDVVTEGEASQVPAKHAGLTAHCLLVPPS